MNDTTNPTCNDPSNLTPDTSTLAGKIAVMQAALEGKPITRLDRDGTWRYYPSHLLQDWNWQHYMYRIGPLPLAPHYRPWTAEEVPVGTVVKKISNPHDRYLITDTITNPHNNAVTIGMGAWIRSAQELFDHFTLLDGTPCGTRETSQ